MQKGRRRYNMTVALQALQTAKQTASAQLPKFLTHIFVRPSRDC